MSLLALLLPVVQTHVVVSVQGFHQLQIGSGPHQPQPNEGQQASYPVIQVMAVWVHAPGLHLQKPQYVS